MDMKNINTFIYTAELGSFTKAAELLGYSQSKSHFRSGSWRRSLAPSFLSGSTAQ